MKNKYKVVALVPLEFSVEGSSDSKEAIESVKNIFEACRDDKDYADIVFDGIEESLRHDSIEYKVEAVQHEPEVKANSDIRSVASDICDIFENYLDENGICIVCDDADEERERKDNESGAMLAVECAELAETGYVTAKSALTTANVTKAGLHPLLNIRKNSTSMSLKCIAKLCLLRMQPLKLVLSTQCL